MIKQMSRYDTVAKGHSLVRGVLPEARVASIVEADNDLPFDYVWKGINIKIKTRSQGGMIGSKSIVFPSIAPAKDIVYIFIALPEEDKKPAYFWIVSSKELGERTSYYAKMSDVLMKPEEIRKTISAKAK